MSLVNSPTVLRRLAPAAMPLALVVCLLAPASSLFAQPIGVTAADFERSIRPMLKQYCLGCHSTEKHKGDLDLERFATLDEVLKHPKAWQGVIEQVALGEMPPKEKPQPTAAERERLLDWVNRALDQAAQARAGDPGPVVLRRLNNAEYTFTVRDLTGIESLNPAKEFPVDSAAGEGFMNTGASLVMSPALLTKYLDAAKEIASHAVLLPDGIRFSPAATRRDWTDEILRQIREFYHQYTEAGGAETVTQQGMQLDKNKGGQLPLQKYLAATLELRPDRGGLDALATERGLSAKYLSSLLVLLNGNGHSVLLEPVRARWRAAKPADVPALVAEIEQWQKVLWKFSSVGHIGKLNGPKAWLEPVNPLATKQEVRIKLPAPANSDEVVLYLVASDAGDGNTNDVVVWQQPRLAVPGRPNLLLRDARRFARELSARRESLFAATAKCLAAASDLSAATNARDLTAVSRERGVDPQALTAWLDFLGIGSGAPPALAWFTNALPNTSNYDFVKGWGSKETPSLIANSSTQHVRIPGNLKAHGVAVHPSPKLNVAVGWRSPLNGVLRIDAKVTHAHPECGNGVEWFLELRRGATRQRLASGTAQGSKEIKVGPIENFAVQIGDLISLIIGPRDGNHSCDLTDVELVLRSAGNDAREWSLTRDISPDVLAGNPHADSFGNPDVWHFYTEAISGSNPGPMIPAGSLLAKWQSAAGPEKTRLAGAVQQLLTSGPPAAKDSPDAALYRQLASLGGPLLGGARQPGQNERGTDSASIEKNPATSAAANWGLDPALFGKHPDGSAIEPSSLCAQAPSMIEIRLPADLVAGAEFVTTGILHPEAGAEGSVQLQALTTKPASRSALLPGTATVQSTKGTWTDADKPVLNSAPILVQEGSKARTRFEASFDEFRNGFPASLCYTKIVPVDEVVTLTLFHREDDHLSRLLLDGKQKAKLDRMWDELHFVCRDALTLVDAYEQLWQFATQDADPKVFEPMRKPINDRAAAFRQRLTNTEPAQVDAVLDFAARAYRRPLTGGETRELRGLYRKLREQEIPHDESVRLTLARVFVAPAFLYRLENAAPGTEPGRVSAWELASRLSYFLWSSQPDAELRDMAASGALLKPDVVAAQARRLLRDERVRRLATEFACQWLLIHDFDQLDEKSERHFPTFAGLRGAMYEEAIRFFTDLFQRDASVLAMWNADYTFLNADLARHYGIPGVTGASWRRVDGVNKYARGGILGMSATLAKQSGASRTSPILRGNWVSEILLGDRLPRPPKDVPRLPEDEATESLTVRELVEKHSSDPKCYGCHMRIDGFGFALEGYDSIGRARTNDLANRPIVTRAKLLDGTLVAGADELRDYLVNKKRDVVLRQFCRKLLGYALGRAVQLSDKPLLAEMQRQLRDHDYHFSAAIEALVRSKQFLEIRGKGMKEEE